MRGASDRNGARTPRLDALLAVAGLTGFAFAQPLFDVLARHSEFLVAHKADRVDAVVLALGIGVVVPIAIATVTAAVDRIASPFRSLAVGALVAATALPLSKSLEAGPAFEFAGPAALGAVAALAYGHVRAVRQIASALSIVVVVFPTIFVWKVWGALASAGSPIVDAGIDADTPVVVVVFDALPLFSLLDATGEIDDRNFPHFASLARRSHWFVEATTVAERTTYAIPAIATGRYPASARPATGAAYPQNLFDVFAANHDLNVVEPFTNLCPATLCEGRGLPGRSERLAAIGSDLGWVYAHVLLPETVSAALPDVTATWTNFASAPTAVAEPARRGAIHRRRADVRWVFQEFLDGVVARDRAALHFLHANLPHRPYKYLPSGNEYGPIGSRQAIHGARKGVWGSDAWEVAQGLQRHQLQVGYADRVLGQLIERLEGAGLYDRALIVVTADHGVSFRPNGSMRQVDRRNPLENAGDIARVPLFIKTPAQKEGVRSDRNAETIDILPTLVATLGGALPDPVDGEDLLGDDGDRPGKTLYVQRGADRARLELPAKIPLGPAVLERLDSSTDGWFGIGPRPELLGREVAALAVAAGRERGLQLTDSESWDDVDSASGFVPAQVTGEISGESGEGPLDLAVSVNGTIRALTRTYADEGGRILFSAMVPEASFRVGGNEVRVFVVHERGGTLALEPTTRGTPTSYAAVADRAGRPAVLVSSRGRLYPLVAGAVTGEVVHSGAHFEGQAVDTRRDRAADAVLMFSNGAFLHIQPLGVDDAEVERPRHRRFRFPIPYAKLGGDSSRHVQFVGLARDAATAIPYGQRRPGSRGWLGPTVEMRLTGRRGSEGLEIGEHWLAIRSGIVRGGVEPVAAAADDAREFRGWALDPNSDLPPIAVMVFVGDTFEQVAAFDEPYPHTDVEFADNPQLATSGFRVRLAEDVRDADPDSIRFIGLSADGVPCELRRRGPSAGR